MKNYPSPILLNSPNHDEFQNLVSKGFGLAMGTPRRSKRYPKNYYVVCVSFKSGFLYCELLPYSNVNSPELKSIGPLPWQAKQTVSALCLPQPAT